MKRMKETATKAIGRMEKCTAKAKLHLAMATTTKASGKTTNATDLASTFQHMDRSLRRTGRMASFTAMAKKAFRTLYKVIKENIPWAKDTDQEFFGGQTALFTTATGSWERKQARAT